MININKDDCCFCEACINICPTKAIVPVRDDCGYYYPRIEPEKCINCNQCEKVCQIGKKSATNIPKKVFAARVKNENIYQKSASGGLASIITKHVLGKKGVVYGCAYTDSGFAHIRISSEKEWEKLAGSKYVQSNLGMIYTDIKDDLDKDRTVLFIGLPCQITGIKMFLKKEYEKLYTIDLICHGVGQQDFLWEEFPKHKMGEISFRDEQGYNLLIKTGKKIYKKPSYLSYYYKGFLEGLLHRENCYTCKYAQPERDGDITLGDFWGLNSNEVTFSINKGVSVVMVNTDKGHAIFNDILGDIYYQEETLEKAMKNNRQLNHPSKKHPMRNVFLESCQKKGYLYAIKKCYKKEITKSTIKYYIKKILLIFGR